MRVSLLAFIDLGLLVTGLVGCGGSGGNAASAQQLCNQSAAATCEKNYICGGASFLADRGYTSVADCTRQSQASCENPICPTGTTYHPDQVQKCIDETKSQPCPDFSVNPPVSCTEVCTAAGTSPADAACTGTSKACDNTYFSVSLYLNRQDRDDNAIDDSIIQLISHCTITVFAGDQQIEYSRELTKANSEVPVCRPNLPDGEYAIINKTMLMKLGMFEYSSARQSGEIRFVITVWQAAGDKQVVIAQGSVSYGVNPGRTLELPLIINACSNADHPKGTTECEDIR